MTVRLPRIGVVLLNWNGLVHLRECLPSVLASDYPEFVVVVVDNGSRDGSVAWLRAHHPGVTLVALPSNLRFAGGNNAGAQAALAAGVDVVLLLNNDTVVDRGLLTALGGAFAADPRLAIAGPRICYWDDPTRIWYGGGKLSLGLAHIAHRAIRASVDAGRDPAGATAWVTGCALAVRAELWRAMEGLDEAFYIYGEDVDFCLRARAAGAGIAYVPEGRLQHKVSASVGGHASAFKVYHKSRATRMLLRRHAKGVARWSAPVALALRELATLAWLVAHRQWAAAAGQVAAWQDGTRRNRYQVPA